MKKKCDILSEIILLIDRSEQRFLFLFSTSHSHRLSSIVVSFILKSLLVNLHNSTTRYLTDI